MADIATNGNGAAGNPAGTAAQTQPIVRVVNQYIKDLSFENPNISSLLKGPGENPNLKISVQVNAGPVEGSFYESAIEFKAEAVNKAGTIYDLELVYAGMFQIENLSMDAIEPFLLINCPSLLFPFVRRLVADLTREGGFPPLLMDPVDFAALYMQRKQQQAGPVMVAKA